MRFDPDAWRRAPLTTTDLQIDLNNPRFAFRHLGGLDGVVKYLVEKEGVLDLAQKIASYGGLFQNEQIIVHDNDGDLIVLEGNRRTLACQILLRPGKFFHDDAIVASIPEIDPQTRDRISQIEASIVTDRRVADPIIASIHVFGKKDWNFLSRMYYAYNNFNAGTDIDTICRSLHCTTKEVYNYIRSFTAIDLAREAYTGDYTKVDLLLNGEVDPQTYLSIVLSSIVPKHFGSPFIWDDGRSNFLGHPDLVSKIKLIAAHTLFGEDEGLYRISKGSIERYLKAVFRRDEAQLEMPIGKFTVYEDPSPPVSPKEEETPISRHSAPADPPTSPLSAPDPIPPVAPPSAHTPAPQNDGNGAELEKQDAPQEDPPSTPATPQPKRLPTREIFFEALECQIADYRLLQITKEIVAVSRRPRGLIDAAISASFLMRALLEWSLLYHARRANRVDEMMAATRTKPGGEPRLADILEYFSNTRDNAYLPNRLREKCKHIKEHWMNDLNCNIHNDYGNHTPDRLSAIAADVRPIVKWVFGYRDDSQDEE